MLRIYDSQKHMGILERYYEFPIYTRPCAFVYNKFEALSAVKLIQQIVVNFNFKECSCFWNTLYTWKTTDVSLYWPRRLEK